MRQLLVLQTWMRMPQFHGHCQATQFDNYIIIVIENNNDAKYNGTILIIFSFMLLIVHILYTFYTL